MIPVKYLLSLYAFLFRFQCIDNGHNLQALHFAIQLAKYVADEKHSPHVTEVSGSVHKFSSLSTILFCKCYKRKFGNTSRQHPLVDEVLYSPSLSAWQCIDIVKRNYRMIALDQTLPNENSGCFFTSTIDVLYSLSSFEVQGSSFFCPSGLRFCSN